MSTQTSKPVSKAVKALQKLLGSKKEDIRLQAAQTLLSHAYLHPVPGGPLSDDSPRSGDCTMSINDSLVAYTHWLKTQPRNEVTSPTGDLVVEFIRYWSDRVSQQLEHPLPGVEDDI